MAVAERRQTESLSYEIKGWNTLDGIDCMIICYVLDPGHNTKQWESDKPWCSSILFSGQGQLPYTNAVPRAPAPHQLTVASFESDASKSLYSYHHASQWWTLSSITALPLRTRCILANFAHAYSKLNSRRLFAQACDFLLSSRLQPTDQISTGAQCKDTHQVSEEGNSQRRRIDLRVSKTFCLPFVVRGHA